MLQTALETKKKKLIAIVKENWDELKKSKTETACEFSLKKDEVQLIIKELLEYKTIQIISSTGIENGEVLIKFGK